MQQYHDLCHKILKEGQIREDRTGTGTISIFHHQMEFDMAEGFPLITTKDMEESFEHIKGEMLWLLEGNTNANYLAEKYGFKIWKKWAFPNGDLGRVYGAQWRQYRGVEVGQTSKSTDAFFTKAEVQYGTKVIEIDQIQRLVMEIKQNPYSRRMLVNAWNPAELHIMNLPPCHWSFECYVDGKEMDTLNLKLHQRSCDVFLGVPYNIAEYSLLLHMLAQVTGLKAGKFVHDMTNVHIYLDHVEQVKEQLKRKPFNNPILSLNPEIKYIFDFEMKDISLLNYKHHDKLKGKVSV